MSELFLSALVTFFVVIDPPGCAPIFASLTRGTPAVHRRAMAIRSTLVAAGILFTFALVGEALLRTLDGGELVPQTGLHGVVALAELQRLGGVDGVAGLVVLVGADLAVVVGELPQEPLDLLALRGEQLAGLVVVHGSFLSGRAVWSGGGVPSRSLPTSLANLETF